MAGTLQAIQTRFDGHLFRSRLEARWAVFFKMLGIPYEYEREGYDLDGLYYLPDFWLPEQQYWVEIKPIEPTPEEQQKLERLVQASGHNGYFCFGDIPWPAERSVYGAWDSAWQLHYWADRVAFCPECNCTCEQPPVNGPLYLDETWMAAANACRCCRGHATVGMDYYYQWCECPVCGRLEMHFEGRGGRCACHRDGDGDTITGATPCLVRAYRAAREARFEYGARG